MASGGVWGVRWRGGASEGRRGEAQKEMVKWHNKDEQLTVFCRSFRSIVYIQTAAAGTPSSPSLHRPVSRSTLSLALSLCLPFSGMGVTCGAMQKLTALCMERELLQQNMHLNNGLCAVQTYSHYRNLRTHNYTTQHNKRLSYSTSEIWTEHKTGHRGLLGHRGGMKIKDMSTSMSPGFGIIST